MDPQQRHRLEQSHQRLKDYQELVYKKKAQGRGHRLLFAVILSGFLLLQAVSLEVSFNNGKSTLQARIVPIPSYHLVPGVLLIAAALGVDTDPLAEWLGGTLTSRKPPDL